MQAKEADSQGNSPADGLNDGSQVPEQHDVEARKHGERTDHAEFARLSVHLPTVVRRE